MPIDYDFYTCGICGAQFDEGGPYSDHKKRHMKDTNKYPADKWPYPDDELIEGFNPEISVRQEILETALELTTGDRAKTYGPPKPNLTCFANLVEAYLKGRNDISSVDATDGAVIMALAKISRIAANKKHKDNYIDGAAYMAIAGECAE